MNTEKVIKRDQKYIMHTYARSPLVLEHGEGMYAYDADGKAYLDFTSGIGVNALGYCHPAWVQAVTMQATRLQQQSSDAGQLVPWPHPCHPDRHRPGCFPQGFRPLPR